MTALRIMMPILALSVVSSLIIHRIDGVYVDSFSNKIIVNYPKLTYLKCNGSFDYDTLAICDLDRVQNQLYSIKSDVTASILSSRKVSLTNEKSDSDSLTIILQVPFSRSVLSIGVSVLDKDYYSTGIKKSFLYPREQKCVLPRIKDDSIIALSIEPLHAYDYEPFDLSWANYLGILFFGDYIRVPKGINTIVYSNQSINDMVFDRLNIQGEYLIIKRSQLIWRDKIFNRESSIKGIDR